MVAKAALGRHTLPAMAVLVVQMQEAFADSLLVSMVPQVLGSQKLAGSWDRMLHMAEGWGL